jgi:phage shock protein C
MNRLYRSDKDKFVAGVCGGLGEYLHVDPLILRILFVLLALFQGVGFIVYLVLWLFTPTASAAALSQEEIMRHNLSEMGERARHLGEEARETLHGQGASPWGNQGHSNNRMFIGGAILVGVGLLVLLGNFGLLWWFNLGRLWPLALIAVGVVILLNNLKGKH